MLQYAKQRVVLLAVLGAAGILTGGILAACRPVQVAPAETVKPVAAATATGSIVAGAPDATPDAAPGEDLAALTLAKEGDKSSLGVEDGSLWIDIESASGIGSAGVTWTVTPTMPVILRLHLGSLEELRLAKGGVETVASVSSSPPHTVRQSTRGEQDAELQPITAGDGAWLDISWPGSGSGTAAAFPLQDGYFDVVLSDPRLTTPGTSLEIRWIDFYR